MEATQSWIGNKAILNEKLRRESYHNLFWGNHTGVVTKVTDDNGEDNYEPSGKPIEQYDEFVRRGKDSMEIPFIMDLTGAPVFGDTTVEGTGEELVLKWLVAFVNQTRKAVMKRSGQMSEARARALQLFNEAQPRLSRYVAKWENSAIFQAFYEGVSPNLSQTNADDGLGVYTRYHPNWYVDNGGVIAAVAGTEGQTATVAELDTAVTTAGGDILDPNILRQLRIKAMKLKIPRIVTASGYEFWLLLCHPGSLASLQGDSQYQAMQQTAYTGRALAQPELNGAAGFIYGFALYEDIVGVRGWDNSALDLFGANVSQRFDPYDGVDNYNSILIGGSAMGRAVSVPLHFTMEETDHQNTIEIAAATINGYNRADFAAETDAGTGSGDLFRKNTTGGTASGLNVLNQSSLILMTDDNI